MIFKKKQIQLATKSVITIAFTQSAYSSVTFYYPDYEGSSLLTTFLILSSVSKANLVLTDKYIIAMI